MIKHRSYTVSGVMDNSGYGSLKLTIGKTFFVIPQAGITKNGLVKKSWQKRISCHDFMWIISHGGEVLTA